MQETPTLDINEKKREVDDNVNGRQSAAEIPSQTMPRGDDKAFFEDLEKFKS